MAIQDNARSMATTDMVSKSEIFRYLEMQFSRADKNHDGQLTAEELEAFTRAITCPEMDPR
jgi:Ca2+-binding EF-hand superfamily protein